MTRRELYKNIAARTGDDFKTIERLGFEPDIPDPKELKRKRRLKLWRQQRRDQHLAAIAARFSVT